MTLVRAVIWKQHTKLMFVVTVAFLPFLDSCSKANFAGSGQNAGSKTKSEGTTEQPTDVAGGFGLTCIASESPGSPEDYNINCGFVALDGSKLQPSASLDFQVVVKNNETAVNITKDPKAEKYTFSFTIKKSDGAKVAIESKAVDSKANNKEIKAITFELPKISRQDDASAAVVAKISKISANPGESLIITGSGFLQKVLTARFILSKGPSQDASITINGDKNASFLLPSTLGLGLTQLQILRDGWLELKSFPFVANDQSNALPIITLDPGSVCTGTPYIDKSGTATNGTRKCSTISPCTDNGKVGCLATAQYKSADLSLLANSNIKKGVSINEILGEYPSDNFPLDGADSTPDLTASNFLQKITSPASFEYFAADGTRYTGAGSDKITAANIVNGIEIFGMTGSAAVATGTRSAWDLRYGVTVNGITGRLKTTCRNRGYPSYFNVPRLADVTDGISLFQQGVSHPWDTIDDLDSDINNGMPPGVVNWNGLGSLKNSQTDCYLILDSPTYILPDFNDLVVWRDVTVVRNSTTASDCRKTDVDCTMQDKITGLSWAISNTASNWSTAQNLCTSIFNSMNNSNGYNNQTGWRLPTQKELMEAYVHGIRSAKWSTAQNWPLQSDAKWVSSFWSESQNSIDINQAWAVNLASGETAPKTKANSTDNKFNFCVR